MRVSTLIVANYNYLPFLIYLNNNYNWCSNHFYNGTWIILGSNTINENFILMLCCRRANIYHWCTMFVASLLLLVFFNKIIRVWGCNHPQIFIQFFTVWYQLPYSSDYRTYWNSTSWSFLLHNHFLALRHHFSSITPYFSADVSLFLK